MINILPPNDKRELTASRTNSLLLRYIFLMLAFIVLVTVEMLVVYFILEGSKQSYQRTISDNEREVASQAAVETKANEFKNNLSTAKTILDKQVHYTNVIKNISDLIPSGVVMDTLTIDPATFGTPTTLDVQVKSYNDAIDFKNRLDKSGKFTNVSFKNITLKSTGDQAYKYSATFNLTFSKELLAQ